ncbi:cytochrome P450 [Nitrospirillum iridis]|uniref:Cytochrome P450 n=1 Tax=Nitrospirillum iridis TaxID=765888 RepID=A0A7X0B271_9PROT|nr:cytochrome P450 [Nitrospirillum iridis]MBB6253330.1 cytochrome P450 [Nitrospirillum iridis]
MTAARRMPWHVDSWEATMTDVAAISQAVPKPDHVPDWAVFDFDMFHDPEYLADPHRRILEMAGKVPAVFWTPRNGGHWMLMSHAANFEASRDPETFSSEIVPRAQIKAMMAALPPGAPRIPQPVPINVDPPEHGQYRVPLQGAFSPKSMLALKDGIRALAAELIEKIKPQGSAEFMAEVAEPLPVQVFLKIFGLPLERQAEYRALVKDHLSAGQNDPREMARRLVKVTAVMRDTVLERKLNPRDDLISLLWQANIGGEPTTIEDMENYCVLLFLAGLDTVMNGMGHGVRHLAVDLDLQRKLRESPKLIAEAAEELLRRYTFTVPPRRVTKDHEFHGVTLKANERVMLFLPAADLDPKEFEGPERYDLDRENKVHIAFGTGPHRCLGSHLARIELQVLYEELLARLPEFRLDPAKPVRYHGGHVVGPDALWLLWDA